MTCSEELLIELIFKICLTAFVDLLFIIPANSLYGFRLIHASDLLYLTVHKAKRVVWWFASYLLLELSGGRGQINS